jgi:anti-anti-sigma factor
MSESTRHQLRTVPAASGGEDPLTSEENKQGKTTTSGSVLHMGRSGQWMEPSEILQHLRENLDRSADGAPGETGDVLLDLSGLEHLDGSALQVLLAIQTEQRQRGAFLKLLNASKSLRKWFEYAGAAELLGVTETTGVPISMEETAPCARS